MLKNVLLVVGELIPYAKEPQLGDWHVPPPEDTNKPNHEFQDPELNPMTNTLLAQNMGRWAEVYFTTPPEKRDEAVHELLRELRTGIKNQNSPSEKKNLSQEEAILEAKEMMVALEKQIAELSRRKAENTSMPVPADAVSEQGIVCPACLSKNKTGQRFCGLCGFSLTASIADAAPEKAVASKIPLTTEPERDGNDWGWLHERNRTAFASRRPQSSSRGWKYAITVVVILILCAVAYLWWRGNLPINAAERLQKHITDAIGRGDSARQSDTGETPERQNPDMNQNEPAEAKTAARRPLEEKSVPSPDSSASSSGAVASRSTIEDGQQELETARRYLDGRGVAKNTALASQWLWRSVAKKNVEAVVLLSGMYAKGDGVPKNCDQARLLLSAAAEKGSQEAREQLKDVTANCR
jgi:hypothetical protein